MYQFKAKYSEMKYYTLCLRNISKDFSINNMEKRKKKNRPKRNWKSFSVNHNAIDTNKILDIHR